VLKEYEIYVYTVNIKRPVWLQIAHSMQAFY